jgi:hypothetical protein
MLEKRLQDFEHHHHVLKSLLLIEFVLNHENCPKDFFSDIHLQLDLIRKLRGFKYYTHEKTVATNSVEPKDVGEDIRKVAVRLVELIEYMEYKRQQVKELANITTTEETTKIGDGEEDGLHEEEQEEQSKQKKKGKGKNSKKKAPQALEEQDSLNQNDTLFLTDEKQVSKDIAVRSDNTIVTASTSKKDEFDFLFLDK